ncbi:MAG: F0F1 ATP synthase subunit gamma [Candidatus Eutrophobiaceae bacterium]
MAGEKEIRGKIASVKNTQKITKAMEMVAASKMRKAKERMHAARPYAKKIRSVIAHVGEAHCEYQHPFLSMRARNKEGGNIGLILVSTDRGLCGGLNSNLFRAALRQMQEWEKAGGSVKMGIIGYKAAGFFGRLGANILGQVSHLGDEPSLEKLLGVAKIMIDAYLKEEIDALYIASNDFVNSMTQNAQFEQLIPIEPLKQEGYQHHWDFIYEPDAKEVIDVLIERYVESLIYQRVVENISCEQAARMVAMKSASDNAGTLIEELQLIYNKARQAAITQELSEIVSGAAAV